jgi:hypothetical protein
MSALLPVLFASSVRADDYIFASSVTSRESKKISAIAATPPFDRTYTVLSQDSRDLTFQEMSNGRIYLAFASKDATVDDLYEDRCQNKPLPANYVNHVFWVDKYADQPGVCLSYESTTNAWGDGDSINPRIGGADGDEGRYIAFESEAENLWLGISYRGTPLVHQVYVHDRKWEQNFLSSSKCDPDKDANHVMKGPNAPSYLWDMSDDGRFLLVSSEASNQVDNLEPTCTDQNGSIVDLFVRDGGDCYKPGAGPCYSAVLYGDFGYHVSPDGKATLNADSQNATMSPDQSLVVFDTSATNPVGFLPDVRGFKDIYYHKGEDYYRISQTALPVCNAAGVLQPITNEFGPALGDSLRPDVDGSGRYVVFESAATDLVVRENNPAMVCTAGHPHPNTFEWTSTGGFSQVYLYDHLTKKIEMISLAYPVDPNDETEVRVGGNGNSFHPKISRDGHFIFFESNATNLMSSATTAHKNIFMWDRYLEQMHLVTPGLNGIGTGTTTRGNGLNNDATITDVAPLSLSVAFQTRATNVVDDVSLAVHGGQNPDCGAQKCQQVYLVQSACGTDTDKDLVCDLLDKCPFDPTKTIPGRCGCGTAETDTDGDLTPDCNGLDGCPADKTKISPGQCGCGVAETDDDGDGTPNCKDLCPTDANKTTPGTCGCGSSDGDSDSDGAIDCKDKCPTNPARVGLGACECMDLKDYPGTCGCNTPDVDTNKNGIADCLDPNANSTPSAALYQVYKVPTGGGKKRTDMRVTMQLVNGKRSYNYKLYKPGFKVESTSTTPYVTFEGLAKGTYIFSYSVTIGSGTGKETTKVSSRTIKIII